MPSLLRVLARAAGPERTDRANRDLALLLALMAGMLNGVGFIATNVYTSHMTGITAAISHSVARGEWRLVALGFEAFTLFVLGAASTAIAFNWARRRRLRSRFAVILAFEAVLVLIFATLAQFLHGSLRPQVFIAVLAYTMGLQNAVITKMSNATIRTTHVTGMVTDIGIALGKLLYRNTPGDPEPVRADTGKLRLHLSVVTAFFVGGVLGVALYGVAGFRSLLVPALVLLAAAAPPIMADLRGRSVATTTHNL